MDASVHQQIIALIERSNRILLCTHRKPDGDAVGSIMALYKALNLLGKEVTAACADPLPEMFDFLPEVDNITQELPGGRDFVVTLDCDKTEVDRLKYHLEDNKIHIVITPKNGRFVRENVSTQERSNNYDLIMTVDVADIPQLGHLYEDNADLFSSLPVVNIDHHVSNTEFGKINYIDVASSSTAEILYGLIRDMEKHFSKSLIVPEVATFLLSGVTTDTGSFQNANTTPKSMEVAADLMDAGANQHDVIKYLFRTKPLSTLKLWGKILTKIEVDERHRLVWSTITQQDLKQSGASIDEAADIIDELMVHAPEAEVVALFKEDQDMISVSFRSKTPQANVMEVAARFGGGGHVQAAGVKFPGKKLVEVMNQVIAALQEAQRQRLGLDGIEEDVHDKQKGPVTQVLDGYTSSPHAAPVSPTLEERAQPMPTPPPAPTPEEVPQPPAAAPAEASGGGTPAPQDIHSQAKAAITAEQSQASDTSFAPSQAAGQERREKPKVDKRFHEPVPDFLQPQPDAQAPQPAEPAPPADEGVKVSYGNQAAATPDIPENSAEPTVTNVNPPAAPAQPTPPPTAPSTPQPPQDNQQGGGDQGAAGAAAAPEKPEPPKDPFALGDDGMTDIERALGGL